MPSTAQQSLLVVEDEAPIAMVLEEILTAKGYEIRVVHNPGDAIAAVRERAPDLMLMDINLSSEIDGIQTIEKIHGEIAEIPHCFITAYSEDEIVARAEATGPMAYLMKPFESGDVLAMVSIALANARRLQERLRRAARLEMAVKQAQEAMLFTDFAGKVYSINESAAGLLEAPAGAGSTLAALAKIVNEAGEDHTADSIDQALSAAASGRFQTYWRVQKPSGGIVPLLVNVSADLGIKEFVFRLKQVPATALRAANREAPAPPPPPPTPPAAAAPVAAPAKAAAPAAPPPDLEDRVTGLPNRRAIEPRISDPDDDPEMFVAALAVDHLTVLKQRFGASAVDQVLLAFSQHLAQHLPDNCLIARWSATVFIAMPKETGTVGLQREISRLLSTPMLHHLQLTGRSALLRITAACAFFRLDGSAVENLDAFVEQQAAK